MNPTRKAILGGVVIFVLGCVFGGMATALFIQHRVGAALQGGPQAMSLVLERRATHGLSLTSDQRQQLRGMFLAYVRQRLELQKSIRPQVKALNQATLAQIEAVLTPDQQERFEQNLDSMQTRFGRNPFSEGTDAASGKMDPTPAIGSNNLPGATK